MTAVVTVERAAELAGWTTRSVAKHIKAGRIPVKGYRVKVLPSGCAVAVRMVDPQDVLAARAHTKAVKRAQGHRLRTATRARQLAALRRYHAVYVAMPDHLKRRAGKRWLAAAKAYAEAHGDPVA